ncbi:MAG TPA: glycosyltransferase family 8 protein [Candidatus Bacteroides merdigallinarum]|uniref:Glycosyltransferase family 8 protein n=1 Tax=Candidatus Bacteroides merdigallinarum TaxID=2838473 RepID=A0A9D2E972_9BACE|nr:glycosyltransferase family 8 protein [Candidatus Bacteroides merdigallinarum]
MTQIPIFFTFDRHYVVPAAVAFHSLLRRADARYTYRLYVLYTDIPQADRRRLARLVERTGRGTLEFIDVSAFDTEEIRGQKGHFSKEIYYKLLAPDLFPQYDRILCSDVDVAFTDDIAPSYFLCPGESFYYAGVGQVLESDRMARYAGDFTPDEQRILRKEIAAGYMLFNLKRMREDGIQHRLTEFYKANYPRLRLPEQDCLILCCYPHVRQMPLRFVVANTYYRIPPAEAVFCTFSDVFPLDRKACEDRYADALACPVQLHFVGADKPWNSLRVPRSSVWWSELRASGYTLYYIKALPGIVRQKLRRYSLRRFLNKIFSRKH